MKKYFLVAIVVLSCSFAFGQQKLGYIDMSKISEQLPEAIKAKSDLDAIANKWQDQLDSMNAKLQSDYATFQKEVKTYQDQQATMKKEKREQTEKQLGEKQKTFIDRDNSIRAFQQEKFASGTGELYKKQEEILKPIKEKIAKAVADVAKEEGVQFVFDKSGDLVLPYADAQFDLTYKVLDKLKRGK